MKTVSLNGSGAPPVRILLVNTNPMGRAARKTILEDQGYEVATAADGLEAIAAFEKRIYALVITDYRMPNMDGLTLIERIRQKSSATPIILISGYVEGLGVSERSTGADSVVAKDAHEVRHLIRVVKHLLKPPAKKPVQTQRAHTSARRRSV